MDIAQQPGLPDVQSSEDTRKIPIDRVGVRGIRRPVVVEGKDGPQPTIADITMTVSLPADQKGTHMSRFIALMEEHREALNANSVRTLMSDMLKLLNAEEGTIEIRFPFFVRKHAPVSGLASVMDYQAGWIADCRQGVTRITQETVAPVTSLCPCSKEISRYGAHNQRSHLTSAVELAGSMSLEEQISISESAASCQLWARLKRSDEKFVTEYAYDHPKFVEDLIRDMAKSLDADDRVLAYRVEAENFESIHNHSAYAYISRDKRNDGR